jgi:hypothetical protein
MRCFVPRRLAVAIMMLSITFTPATSHAFVGEENLLLAEIVAALGRQMVQLRQTAQDVRQNVQYARQSAVWAHDALQVAKNVQHLKTHPSMLMQQAGRRFEQSFPEGQALVDEWYGLEEEIQALRRHRQDPDYDAYAYAAAVQGTKKLETFRYELMIRKLDTLGVHTAHDDALAELKEQHEAAIHNLAELQSQLETTGLSPTRAPLYTARATSVGAAAQVRAAATLQGIKRNSDLTWVESTRAREASAEAWMQQQQNLRQIKHSWRLTPMPERSEARP